MAVFGVRLHPRTPLSASGALLLHRCCCSAARLPPIERRPLGFAPPPHDGFALLASATWVRLAASTFPMCLLCMHHTLNPSPKQYPLAAYFRRGTMPICCFVSRSLMPALLPASGEFPMNFGGLGVAFSRHL